MKTKNIIIAGLAGLLLAACTEDVAEKKPATDSYKPMKIEVTDTHPSTRANYSGFPSTTFETDDAIGVYAFDGTSYVASNIRFVKQSDGSWLPDEEVPYVEDYTYYAYFPYSEDVYTPSTSGTVNDVDTKFASFIEDDDDYFWQADQSTKDGYTYSNLMIAKGTITDADDDEVTIKFTMAHKRGLAVFTDDIADATFTGNIPYLIGDTKQFLMKPSTATSFTDGIGTYSLNAPSGEYVTHKIELPYTFSVASGSTSYNQNYNSHSHTVTITSMRGSSAQGFTISSSASSWLKATQSGSGTTKTVTVNVTANSGTSSRSGTITLTQVGSGNTLTISYTQTGSTYTFSSSPENMYIQESSSSGSFSITSYVNSSSTAADFTITNSNSWLTVSKSGSGSTKTVSVSATANSGAPRIGTITLVQSGSNRTLTIRVIQAESGHSSASYINIGGTNWAKTNIGASSESDDGLYFSWGDITGYSGGSGHSFSSANYSNGSSGSGYTLTGSFTSGDATYDAATANTGSPWKMPTKTQYDQLLKQTNYLCKYGSKNGWVFCSSSATLFFPASGRYTNTTRSSYNSGGVFWTTTYSSSSVANTFSFGLGGAGMTTKTRSDGASVRAVK